MDDLTQEWSEESRQLRAAWFAGFFDGEGCIQALRTTRKRGAGFALTLTIGQADPAPLRLIRDYFGGNVHACRRRAVRVDGSPGQPMWHWNLGGRFALALLKQLRPFMIVKSAEAEVAIELFDRYGWRQQIHSPEDLAFCEERYQQLRELKRDYSLRSQFFGVPNAS